GGGIYNEYKLTIKNGNIVGNTAIRGGGVYNTSQLTTFTMKGGNIVGNTAGEGSGILFERCTIFDITGGAIKDSIAIWGRETGTVTGGYFGKNALDPILGASCLGSKSSYYDNDGSNSAYPKDMYPYMVK
ncbi:MAG: hypothetical protein J6Q42_00605, partial [Clostridia bacterium]|nr:hypothetical protein [Clostridia bacterium]